MGRKEVPIGRSNVRLRRRAGSAAQHHLIAHELAVVLADRSLGRLETGIGAVGAGRPFPNIAEHLRQRLRRLNRLNRARMQTPALETVSCHPARSRRNFPFEFSWESRSRPARKGVGLVIADMSNRFVQVEWLHAFDGVMPPLAISLLPVQRSAPLIVANTVPSIRKPQLGCAVTVVAHEFEILTVGHQPGGQAESFQINIVPRTFVVEPEAVACKTYAVDPFVEAAPLRRRDRGTRWMVIPLNCTKRWPKRIRPQPVLYVGDDQLLMLLLMVDSERHQRDRLGRKPGCEHMHDGIVHIGAVGMYFVQSRTRQRVSQRPQRSIAHGVVIRIKQTATVSYT